MRLYIVLGILCMVASIGVYLRYIEEFRGGRGVGRRGTGNRWYSLAALLLVLLVVTYRGYRGKR